jgi:hypothetical protein
VAWRDPISDAGCNCQYVRYVASLAAGCEIVFEYIVPAKLLGTDERKYLAAMESPSVHGGHMWQALYQPSEIVAMLNHIGFVDVIDLDSELINARYFTRRDDGLRVPAASHLVKARGRSRAIGPCDRTPRPETVWNAWRRRARWTPSNEPNCLAAASNRHRCAQRRAFRGAHIGDRP